MAKKRKMAVPSKSLRRSSPPSEDDDDEPEGRESSEEASSSSSSSRKELREFLEPMEKEQLIETIVEAAALSPSLLARITSADEDDTSLRNIYIHGLPRDATSYDLAAAFSSFGAIENCNVAIEGATGRCKGYGFVLFYTCDAAQRALCQPQKKIAGHTTACQLAATRPRRRYAAQDSTTADPGADRTILIGNVGEHISADQLRAFFSQFGEMEEGPPERQQLRGNAIITYKTAEGCRKALEEPKKLFEGCELHCEPGDAQR